MQVYIKVRTVVVYFGTVGVVYRLHDHHKMGESDTTRPYGFKVAAFSDGEALARKNGWEVVRAPF